jgi:DNA-binding GntR family transcriptional regulator
LREVELSRSLEVSRGTVREALRRLTEEGLVEVLPHRGAFVTRLSPRRIREVFTLRALLEPYAVRQAMEAGAYGDEDLATLEAVVEQLGELEGRGDISETLKADVRFHFLMCERSEHELLLKVLKSFQSLTMLHILNSQLYYPDLISAEHSHRMILEAIRQGDAAYAADVVRNHLSEGGKSLLTKMEAADWPGGEEA